MIDTSNPDGISVGSVHGQCACDLLAARTKADTLAKRVEELEDTLRVLHSFAKEVVEEFDCDCREDYYEPGEKCFWCKAKEALREPPEVVEDDEEARRLDQADMPGGFP